MDQDPVWMFRKRENLLAPTVNRTPHLRLSRWQLKTNTDRLNIVTSGTSQQNFAATDIRYGMWYVFVLAYLTLEITLHVAQIVTAEQLQHCIL